MIKLKFRNPNAPIAKARSIRQKGASAVEFALVAPVFLFITFALIEYAVIFGALFCLNSATAEAARRTTVFQAGFSEANYKSFADTALSSALPTYIGSFKANVTLATSLEDCGTERCIRFKATYGNYAAKPLIFHFPDFILPGSLVSESVARIEVDPFSN